MQQGLPVNLQHIKFICSLGIKLFTYLSNLPYYYADIPLIRKNNTFATTHKLNKSAERGRKYFRNTLLSKYDFGGSPASRTSSSSNGHLLNTACAPIDLSSRPVFPFYAKSQQISIRTILSSHCARKNVVISRHSTFSIILS